MVADLLAVEVKLIIAEAADVGAGLFDLALKRERPAEHRRRQGIGVCGAANPLALPILRGEQTHFPVSWPAIGGGLPVLVPHSHLPIAPLAGRERLAGMGNVQRLVRRHLAGVPKVAAIRLQQGLAAGDENPICVLIRGPNSSAVAGCQCPRGYPDTRT